MIPKHLRVQRWSQSMVTQISLLPMEKKRLFFTRVGQYYLSELAEKELCTFDAFDDITAYVENIVYKSSYSGMRKNINAAIYASWYESPFNTHQAYKFYCTIMRDILDFMDGFYETGLTSTNLRCLIADFTDHTPSFSQDGGDIDEAMHHINCIMENL